MITTELMGGLGNQLFQVYNLISYCLDNNNIFVLEKHTMLYGPIRNCNVYWNNIFKNISSNCKETLFKFPIYKEPSFSYNKIPYILPTQNVKFHGYFQSYKYFDHNLDKINDILKLDILKQEISSKNKLDYENIISLHFRIGDYAKLQHYHPLMTPEYYINSINYIIEKTTKEDWKILVFCEKDDIDIVNSKLSIIKERYEKIEFVICNHNLQDWEQMLQMSLCKHNIIANSSFSWWGAYLNNNKDKIVCAPKKWFGDNVKHNTSDLYLKEWELWI
tara:strand:- start:6459 stop:7286 length:828 start_codon:yes stop_codon:yes gene_type:complete